MLTANLFMLPGLLLALILDFPGLYAPAYAKESFLSDNLVRKDQVQNVLEHQPVKQAGCRHIVSLTVPTLSGVHNSLTYRLANGSHRSHHVRL